jgi:hypothetical protein
MDYVLLQEYFLLTPSERHLVGHLFGWLGKSNQHIGPGGSYKKWYVDAHTHARSVEQELYDVLMENPETDWTSILYYQHIHAQQSYADQQYSQFHHPDQHVVITD